jgi:hypothetical protein
MLASVFAPLNTLDVALYKNDVPVELRQIIHRFTVNGKAKEFLEILTNRIFDSLQFRPSEEHLQHICQCVDVLRMYSPDGVLIPCIEQGYKMLLVVNKEPDEFFDFTLKLMKLEFSSLMRYLLHEYGCDNEVEFKRAHITSRVSMIRRMKGIKLNK